MTGSAHTVLAPFWSEKTGGRKRMEARQCSPRGGEISLEVEGEELRAAGAAAVVMEGRMFV